MGPCWWRRRIPMKVRRSRSCKRRLLCIFSVAVVLCTLLLLHGHAPAPTTTAGHARPWSDLNWVRKVLQSALSKKAGGYVVLVTGAAGFVGYHSSFALSMKGHGVVGLDNFNKLSDPDLKRWRQALLKRKGVVVVDGDINDGVLLKKLFSMAAFTHVLHLTEQAGVRDAHPHSLVHSNLAGLVSLLEVCARATSQPAFVWGSSSFVYGLNEQTPFSEHHRTDRPASLYAATKKAGEAIVHSYNHVHNLSITTLRFFTVYGPWGNPNSSMFRFTKAILEGTAVTVYQGSNNNTIVRDWIYLDDIVNGCLAALETSESSKRQNTRHGVRKKRRIKSNARGGRAQLRTINLGNSHPVAVVDLLRTLEKHLKRKAIIIFESMDNNGDMEFTSANIVSDGQF